MSSEPTAKESSSLAELSALATARCEYLRSAVRQCNLELDDMSHAGTEAAETADRERGSATFTLSEDPEGIAAARKALDSDEDQGPSLWNGLRGSEAWPGRKIFADTLTDFRRGRCHLVHLLLEMRTEIALLDEFVSKVAQAPSGMGELEVMTMRFLAAERERDENEAARKEEGESAWIAGESPQAAAAVAPDPGSGTEAQVLPDGEQEVEAQEGGGGTQSLPHYLLEEGPPPF